MAKELNFLLRRRLTSECVITWEFKSVEIETDAAMTGGLENMMH